MNWEAIGAVAELAGALGVIISLIYLAKQISTTNKNVDQNTAALLNQSEAASISEVINILSPQITDPAVAQIMLKGHADLDALDPIERHRYTSILLLMFELHQTYYIQHVRGTAGTETWDYYARMFDRLMHVPGVIAWWQRARKTFDPNFATYIDAKLPAGTDLPLGA